MAMSSYRERLSRIATCFALVVCIAPRMALAQTQAPTQWSHAYPTAFTQPDHVGPPIREERKWYGWQTLAVDGASLGSILIGAERDKGAMIATGVVGYFVGPPIVHFSHGHVGKGFGSFGLRVAPILLFVGAVASCYDDYGSEGGSGCGPLMAGAALGIPAAIAIDAAVIARETVTHQAGRLHVVPRIGKRGGEAVVAGAF